MVVIGNSELPCKACGLALSTQPVQHRATPDNGQDGLSHTHDFSPRALQLNTVRQAAVGIGAIGEAESGYSKRLRSPKRKKQPEGCFSRKRRAMSWSREALLLYHVPG